MQDQITQSSSNNPTITYRTPNGQTVTSPLSDAPPQVQLLYQKLPQAQAETQQAQLGVQTQTAQLPGVQAETGIKQVEQKQATSPLSLKDDLSKGMTLKSALSKYSSLMNPDDIFKNYLAQSPYGLPNESPTDLQNMGISPKALGNIGENGSFADRWNTKQAVLGMRDLKGKWNGVNLLSKLGVMGVGVPTPSSQGYDTQRQFLGQHLNSLIPGSPGGQGPSKDIMDKIPDVARVSELEPGAADARFQGAEEGLLNVKGYTYKDLGLTPPKGVSPDAQAKTPSKPTSGGDFLSTLLNNATEDVKGINKSLSTNPLLTDILDPNAVKASVSAGNPVDVAKGMATPYADIVTKGPVEAFKEHPVNTTLAVLGPLLGMKTGGEGEVGGGDVAAENISKAAENIKAPNKLTQMFTPGRAKNAVGNIRDNLIATADKSNVTISGDTVAQGIRAWADNAKLSNLPDAQAIEDAAAQAEKTYAGKTFKPSDLKKIYDGIEKGYTKGGEPRSATASYIDRGIKSVLSDHLDRVAPGFKRTSNIFDQIYNSEKSPAKTMVKRAAGVGLGLSGYDAIRHILGL